MKRPIPVNLDALGKFRKSFEGRLSVGDCNAIIDDLEATRAERDKQQETIFRVREEVEAGHDRAIEMINSLTGKPLTSTTVAAAYSVACGHRDACKGILNIIDKEKNSG